MTASAAKLLSSLTNAIEYVTRLFNSILKFQYFPNAWKSGIVLVLPKPGKPPLPQFLQTHHLTPHDGKCVRTLPFGKAATDKKKQLSILHDEQHGDETNLHAYLTYHLDNPTVRQIGTLPVTGGRGRHPLWRANGDGGSSHNTWDSAASDLPWTRYSSAVDLSF